MKQAVQAFEMHKAGSICLVDKRSKAVQGVEVKEAGGKDFYQAVVVVQASTTGHPAQLVDKFIHVTSSCDQDRQVGSAYFSLLSYNSKACARETPQPFL